jgi:hypothetical protein
MLDKNLVHAIVYEKDLGGRDLDCGSAELSVNLGLTNLGLTNLGLARGHDTPSSFASHCAAFLTDSGSFNG